MLLYVRGHFAYFSNYEALVLLRLCMCLFSLRPRFVAVDTDRGVGSANSRRVGAITPPFGALCFGFMLGVGLKASLVIYLPKFLLSTKVLTLPFALCLR